MKKEDTIAEYRESINRVVLYIQERLDQKMTLEEISLVAGFSRYHFHRIFAALTGEPLGEYILRLRLERAAVKLGNSRDSITRIALDSGYDTPAALTRAFKKRFNVTPSLFRKEKSVFLKSIKQAAPSVIIDLTEVDTMKPEIRNLNDQTVIFVRRTGDYNVSAEEAWKEVCTFAGSRGLMDQNTRFIGISYDDPGITEPDKLRYDACVTIDGEAFPEGEVGVQTVKGGKYAVFLHQGPYNKLYETYKKIYSSWLPSSGEKPRDLPCFELYLSDCREVKPEDMKTEIYIPIE